MTSAGQRLEGDCCAQEAHAQRRALRFHMHLAGSIALSVLTILVLSTTLLIAAHASDHGTDRQLAGVWWSHEQSYGCCITRDPRCADGVLALRTVVGRQRARLQPTDPLGHLRHQATLFLGGIFGAADFDLEDTSRQTPPALLERALRECPALGAPPGLSALP